AAVVDVLLRAPTSSRVVLVGEVLRPAPSFLVVGEDCFPADLFIGDIEPSLWCGGRRRPNLADVVRHDTRWRAHVRVEPSIVTLRHDDPGVCIRRRPRHPDGANRTSGRCLFRFRTPSGPVPGPRLRTVHGATTRV